MRSRPRRARLRRGQRASARGAGRLEPIGVLGLGGKLRTYRDELRAEMVPRAGDAALDRADVEVERDGDLAVGAIEDVPQGENFTVAGVESFHARRDEIRKFSAHIFLGGTGGVGGDQLGKRAVVSAPSGQSGESVRWRRRRKKYP